MGKSVVELGLAVISGVIWLLMYHGGHGNSFGILCCLSLTTEHMAIELATFNSQNLLSNIFPSSQGSRNLSA